MASPDLGKSHLGVECYNNQNKTDVVTAWGSVETDVENVRKTFIGFANVRSSLPSHALFVISVAATGIHRSSSLLTTRRNPGSPLPLR